LLLAVEIKAKMEGKGIKGIKGGRSRVVDLYKRKRPSREKLLKGFLVRVFGLEVSFFLGFLVVVDNISTTVTLCVVDNKNLF